MKRINATILYFRYQIWPEIYDLMATFIESLRDVIFGLLFLVLSPLIILYRIFNIWREFGKCETDLLDKFLEDPKKHSKSIGRYKKYQL